MVDLANDLPGVGKPHGQESRRRPHTRRAAGARRRCTGRRRPVRGVLAPAPGTTGWSPGLCLDVAWVSVTIVPSAVAARMVPLPARGDFSRTSTWGASPGLSQREARLRIDVRTRPQCGLRSGHDELGEAGDQPFGIEVRQSLGLPAVVDGLIGGDGRGKVREPLTADRVRIGLRRRMREQAGHGQEHGRGSAKGASHAATLHSTRDGRSIGSGGAGNRNSTNGLNGTRPLRSSRCFSTTRSRCARMRIVFSVDTAMALISAAVLVVPRDS